MVCFGCQVKKDDAGNSSVSKTDQSSDAPHLWTELSTLLNRHFSEEDARKVLDEFRNDFYGNLRNLSLDDIERLAIHQDNICA